MRRQTSVYRAGSISARPSSKKLRKQKKQLEKEIKKNTFSRGSNSATSSSADSSNIQDSFTEQSPSLIVDDISYKEEEEHMIVEEKETDINNIQLDDVEMENDQNENEQHLCNCDDHEENEKLDDAHDVEEEIVTPIPQLTDDRENQECEKKDILEDELVQEEPSPAKNVELINEAIQVDEVAEDIFIEKEESNNYIETKEEIDNIVETKEEIDNITEPKEEISNIIVTNEQTNENVETNEENITQNDVTEFDIVEVTEESKDVEMDAEPENVENEDAVPPSNGQLNENEQNNNNDTSNNEVEKKSLFTIKPEFFQNANERKNNDANEEDDYEMVDLIDEKKNDKTNNNSNNNQVNDEPTVLLDHERYVLKKINGVSKSQFDSNILYSKLDPTSDIYVNLLENGNICFFNISDKHRLFLEKNLLTLLNISIADLPFIKIFFSPNAKSLASLKKIDEITTNPSIIILNSRNGTIWRFENLNSSFQMGVFNKLQNDSIIKNDSKVNESDFVYLSKISCLLMKNYKRQLVLFNLLTNEVTKLRYSPENTKGSLFGRLFKGGKSTRKDVIDFEIENSITEQTISVLFDSDFAFYNIRKFETIKGCSYDFAEIIFNESFELPTFITQSVLGEVGAIILIKYSKIFEDGNAKYYSFLLSTGFDNLLLVTAKISNIFEVISFYNVNYFQRETFDNTELIELQTAFIKTEKHYTSFIKFENNINLVQIPLLDPANDSNIIFRDIICFQTGSEVKNSMLYEFEENDIKTYCLSFQTTNSTMGSFYQLHIKDIGEKIIQNTDSLSFFLKFHLRNYLMTNTQDTGLSNIIQNSWFNKDSTVLVEALKSIVSDTCSSQTLNTIEQESMLENLLISIHSNLSHWQNDINIEELKTVLLTTLDYLSLLKCFNSVNLFSDVTSDFIDLGVNDSTNKFKNIEMILSNTLDKINKNIYEAKDTVKPDISNYISRALKFLKVSIYQPIIGNVESHYRNGLFKDIILSENDRSLPFSETLASKLSDFILLVGQLKNTDASLGEGLFMLLKILYYYNSNSNNTLFIENHVHWLGSILKISTEQTNSISKNNIFDEIIIMLEYYHDLIGVFKVLDYLLFKKLISYEYYSNLFSVSNNNRQDLIESYVEFYVNKSYNHKLQLFFDIIMNLDDKKLTSEIYQILLQKNAAEDHSEILWPFETLINKNYDSAFNVLFNKVSGESEEESVDNSESKNNKRSFKLFESSMARLCSDLKDSEVEKEQIQHIDGIFNKYT